MSQGWIRLWRKLDESPVYQSLSSKQRDVMIQCLLSANHKDFEWEWQGKIVKCKAGQFVTSLDSLRRKCGKDVKVQSLKTALLKLEKWGFLTNESTKQGRIITICNWDTYQSDEGACNKQSNRQLTNDQPTTNRQLTPNKNDKKEENDKNISLPASGDADEVWVSRKKKRLSGKRLETFKAFWDAFDYRKDRASAIDAWLAIPNLTDAMVDKICDRAAATARSRPCVIESGRTPIYAQGWLSSRRWEDEATEVPHLAINGKRQLSLDELGRGEFK